MRIIVKTFLALAPVLAAGMLASCEKEAHMPSRSVPDGETVSVRLNLTAEVLTEMTPPLTKGSAIDVSDNLEVNEVKNLWIIQFSGTGDDAKRIGNPVYIENYEPSTAVKIIASTVVNRLLFVANTFTGTVAFGDCSTLADAKAMTRSIAAEQDAVHSETDGGVTRHYPILNGYQDAVIQSDMTISSTLKHSVARVDVKVVNSVSSTLTVESVTVKSVPDRINYITDYTLPEQFPSVSSFGTVNYAPTPWSDGEEEGGSDTRKFTFYLPANMRGVASEDTQEGKYKGSFSPDKATYMLVTASYMEGDIRRSVTYTFYLGANLVNDFNLMPNGHYSYTFTINGKGDEDTDGRVSDTGTVNFCIKGLANSYIINPPEAKDSWRNYRIPVKRVYDFWKEDGKYENNGEYALLGTSPGWVVDVIWSEFPIDDDHFKWVRKDRKKSEGLNPENDWFEFSVKEGVRGNCVVGIRRYTNESSPTPDDFYLWSWHLWVTDYKPDNVKMYTVTPSDGRYIYNVPGGAVHRYNNDIFNTGKYAGKVIMDRNLGAHDINYHYADGKMGALYYQFGRKDPFAGTRQIYIRQNDGSFANDEWSTTTYTKQNTECTDVNCRNVPYSIMHPLIFIKGEYWTYNDIYNPTDGDIKIRWQDPYVTDDTGKSIFDPCPAGWKVPDYYVWNGFTAENFVSDAPLSKGRNYFPNGSSDSGSGTIFFPAHGYMSDGSFSGYSYAVILWMNKPSYVGSRTNGTTCMSQGNYLAIESGNLRTFGFSVRCVQE